MADKKISELTAAPTAMTVNDVVPLVQDGDTVKASPADLLIQVIGAAEYATDIAGVSGREIAALTANTAALDSEFSADVLNLETGLMASSYLHDLAGAAARTLAETPRLRAAPASASAAGTQGEWAWDSNFIYVCTALNTWKRVAIATW